MEYAYVCLMCDGEFDDPDADGCCPLCGSDMIELNDEDGAI